MRSTRTFVALAFVSTLATSHAAAQPASHWSRDFALPGFNGSVYDVVVFQGELLAGGRFQFHASEPIAAIGAWDGSSWRQFGGGLIHEAESVRALQVFQGDLIVAGHFQIPLAGGGSAKNIARWDGTQWHAMGPGIYSSVSDLMVWNGTLVASGSFRYDGNFHPLRGVGMWNGEGWTPFSEPLDAGVAFVVEHQGDLYLANDAHPSYEVLRWTGSSWEVVGIASGGRAFVLALLSWNGDLVIGGDFASVDGVPAADLAVWNGSTWAEFGGGAESEVRHLRDLGDGTLLAGGEFATIGGQSAGRVARWDGASWEELGNGANGFAVLSSTDYDSDIVVCGTFHAAGTDGDARNIARWTGAAWSALGHDGLGLENFARTRALLEDGSAIVVAGRFTGAGGDPFANIARFNGVAWQALGDGLDGEVFSMTHFQGNVVAGGDFLGSEKTALSRVGMWNGTNWSPLGAGFDATVRSLFSWNGSLYAGGDFSGHVAEWDGFSWSVFNGGTNGTVHTLFKHGGALLAGGAFDQAGGVGAANLARWDGTWSEFAGGTDGVVRVIDTLGSDLIVGGDFDTAGGVLSERLSRWDGATWSELGSGLTPEWSAYGYGYLASVHDVETCGDDLLVTGALQGANEKYGLLRWNESQDWADVDGGLGFNGIGDALLQSSGRVYVGGSFLEVGEDNAPSRGIGAWISPLAVSAPMPLAWSDIVFTGGPSPFQQSTRFRFSAPSASFARLSMHDVQGRLVTVLLDGPVKDGGHSLVWDGRDSRGRPVPAGVYFARLWTDQGNDTRKLVRLR